MSNNPYVPFNNKANNRQTELGKSKDLPNPNPERDVDNVGKVPKTPSFARNTHPTLAPIGNMGIKRSSPEQIKTQGTKSKIDVHAAYPEKDGWLHVTNDKTNQAYCVKLTELPSEQNLNGGTISQLVYLKDQVREAEFERGWKIEPESDFDRESINSVCDLFDPPDKEFKPIQHDDDRERGR